MNPSPSRLARMAAGFTAKQAGRKVGVTARTLLPRRRGHAWEEWEDQLLLDDHLTARAIAGRIGRTPHSISERRRWLLRHRAMLRKVLE